MKRFLLLLTIILTLNPSVYAQLSGNYTIGGNVGASNFATWTDFAQEFNKVGVSGKVQVTIQSNTSISSCIELKQHSTYPTTATNTLVFTGNGYSVTGSITKELLLLNGADYIEIKNVKFVNSSNTDSIIGIRIANQADFISINGCTIQFNGSFNIAKSASAYIAFADNNRNLLQTSSNHLGVNNTVKSCTLTTTANNSPGPYYGILHQGGIDSFKSVGTKNTFEGNNIQNFYTNAIFSRYSNGDRWLNNTITRSSASSSSPVDSNLVVIKMGNSYTASQSTLIFGNTITNLPFVGATGTSKIRLNLFVGIELNQCDGTSATDFIIEGNTISHNVAYNYFEGITVLEGVKVIIKKNLLSYNRCYFNRFSYGFKILGTTDIVIVQNRITKEIMGEFMNPYNIWNRVMFLQTIKSKYLKFNLVEDNIIDSNIWRREGVVFFGEGINYTSLSMSKNQVFNNEAIAFNSGGVYRGGHIQIFSVGVMQSNLNIVANLVANNKVDSLGEFIFLNQYVNGGSTSLSKENNICNNTVYFTSDLNHKYGPVGIFLDFNEYTKITGNIFYYDCPNATISKTLEINTNLTTTPFILELDHNTYYIRAKSESWKIYRLNYTNFKDYKSLTLAGKNENSVKVKFADVEKNDFRQYSILAQNNVPYRSINEKDIYKRVRNKKFHDRGAIETYFDLAADTSDLKIPNTVCSGWKRELGIRIKNKNSDTVYDFYVAYSVNGIVNREFVTQRIASQDTYTYYFKNPLIINALDSVTVCVYVDAKDDTLSNDTFVFKTFVKRSPGGSAFIPIDTVVNSNKPWYRADGRPDVTILGLPVVYSMPPPRTYSNSQFDTGWSASVSAYSFTGKKIPGTTLTKPSSISDLTITFETKDSSLEDSVIRIAVTFTNYRNGCDTTILREVYIAPVALANFKTQITACTGDTLQFENASSIKKGYFYSTWDFGTGISADTSSDINSTFVYSKPGIYKVKLTTKTVDFGFTNSKEIEVDVAETPMVDFSKKNSCSGAEAEFINKSSPAKAKNYWDFGDGKGESRNDSTRVVNIYKNAGIYTIKLRIDNKGCIATALQKIQQFETPVAAFDQVSGRCSKEIFNFTNKSTLTSGKIGSRWYFNSYDSVSTATHGKTRLNQGGKNWIQLIVKSDMGCADTLMKEIVVYQSPIVDFDVDRACKYVVSQFINKTLFDTAFNNSYRWDFGDGTKSSLKLPTKKWNSLGGYTVKLVVESANLCSDSLSKNIQVLESVFPAFSANNACSGDPVSFKNLTTWESGKINYLWDFADNTFNNTSDPIKSFNPKITTSYFVTLKASITGGCADSFTQRVDIYETPRTCAVEAIPDYSQYHWGIKVSPKDKLGNIGGQDNVDYTFIIPGIDTVTVSNSGATAILDGKSDGVYTVFMTAKMRNVGNCVCSGSTTITIDRLDMVNQELLNTWQVQASPNPNNGSFKLSVFGIQQVNSLRLKTMNGAVINEMQSPITVRASNTMQEVTVQQLNISPGLYILEVNTDLGSKTLRLIVQ